MYYGHRRNVPRSGVRAESVAELRGIVAERTLAALAQAFPSWRVCRTATTWWAHRPHCAWITRDQLEKCLAYQLRAATAVELRELLEWQDSLGEPTQLHR